LDAFVGVCLKLSKFSISCQVGREKNGSSGFLVE
jgi:hypothetical protein